MDKNKGKIDQNRIYNLQRAGAEDYDFTPEIIGSNIDSNPDFYINLIIGISYKYLSKEAIGDLFATWEWHLKRDKYDMGFLFLLEDFAYKKEIKSRPVLENLRKSYAQKFLSDAYDLQRRNLALKENFIYRMHMIRTTSILGQKKHFSQKDLSTYKNFCLAQDTDSKNLKTRVLDLFSTYLGYRENSFINKIGFFNINFFDSAGSMSLERSNMPRDFKNIGQETNYIKSFFLNITTKHRKEKLDQIEKTFGKAYFSEDKRLAIEEKICTGGHKKSKIYFSAGIENKSKNLKQEKIINRHLLTFKKDQNFYNSCIKTLSRQIKQKINQVSDFDYNLSKSGKLIPGLAYKSVISNRARIFEKKALATSSSMKVDLLIDGSASLIDKESEVAIEAYILSKSLENNQILNRVISFQSLGDFTILTILKNYKDPSDMKKIFRFKSMGWNRDGLVFMAYDYLCDKNTLALVLTDANPSDLRPLISKGLVLNKSYQDQVGIDDTKKALDGLRKKRIKIAGLINSDRIKNAKDLYHNDFIKIKDIREISIAAGKFIKKKIQKS